MSLTALDTYTNLTLQPSRHPEDAKTRNVVFAQGTYTKGQAVAKTTATNKWGAYADAGAGGLGVFKGLLAYDLVVDANGKHLVYGGQHGEKSQGGAMVYIAGYFFVLDTTGVDAALIDVGGRIIDSIDGTLANAEILIPGA